MICSLLLSLVTGQSHSPSLLGEDDTDDEVSYSLTWQDFYRVESEDDTFQDVIDVRPPLSPLPSPLTRCLKGLLNASIFIYIGTIIPWSEFTQVDISLTPWRLVVLALLILMVRRAPWIMALYPFTPAIEDTQQAVFVGWFGPIGVSAVCKFSPSQLIERY